MERVLILMILVFGFQNDFLNSLFIKTLRHYLKLHLRFMVYIIPYIGFYVFSSVIDSKKMFLSILVYLK